MDDTEILRALYRSVQWDKFYRILPNADRKEADDLFRRLTKALQTGAVESPQGEGHRSEPASLSSEERITLHCDGASKGNPGPAGIGMVLTAEDGSEIQAWGQPIGRATNNVAEYRALIAGLERALALGAQELKVRSDSQLMVRQINGVYKVKNRTLRGLYEKATNLLGQFDSCTVEHVERSKNSRADKIASREAKRIKNAKS